MKPEWLAALAGALVGWLAADAVNKTPDVRILDVVVLGPYLVVVALEREPAQLLRIGLAFAGGATITYNLKNYLGNLERGNV